MERQGSCYAFRVIYKFVFSLVVFFGVSCHVASEEEWITEEVLKQLSEIRQELKSLQDEVKSLKSTIEQQPAVAFKGNPRSTGPIDIADSPSIGSESAQVAVIEFSDYQCPYCRRHYTQTLPELEKAFVDTGKIKYVMKQFPLGFHAKARGASIAALCVEKLKPGSYFKAHSAIFSGSISLDQTSYLTMAQDIGIDSDPFESCLADPKMSQVVDNDMAQGDLAGVTGTPAFLIGRIKDGKLVDGRLISGARPFASFSTAIESFLN